MAEEPEEVDDAERQASNKAPICGDEDDPNEEDDDCPKIFNMGGNAEMVLNKVVGNYVFIKSKQGRSFGLSHNLLLGKECVTRGSYSSTRCVTKPNTKASV